jgi:hypothetical protein
MNAKPKEFTKIKFVLSILAPLKKSVLKRCWKIVESLLEYKNEVLVNISICQMSVNIVIHWGAMKRKPKKRIYKQKKSKFGFVDLKAQKCLKGVEIRESCLSTK